MIYYQDNLVTLHLGRCEDVLPTLQDVNLIVTSPPYNQTDRIDRGRGRSARWHRMGSQQDWYPDDMDYQAYMAWQIEVLELCADVLKPDGSVMYNHKQDHIKRRVHHPLDWIRRVEKLALVEEIVWSRPGGMALNAGLFVPSHEMLYWLCRVDSKPRWPARHAMLWGSVWSMQWDREMPGHPCAFPRELPKRCIEALTEPGDLVVDIFGGAGTTARAAKDLGRRCVSIEIEERFCEMAAGRLQQEVMHLELVP